MYCGESPHGFLCRFVPLTRPWVASRQYFHIYIRKHNLTIVVAWLVSPSSCSACPPFCGVPFSCKSFHYCASRCHFFCFWYWGLCSRHMVIIYTTSPAPPRLPRPPSPSQTVQITCHILLRYHLKKEKKLSLLCRLLNCFLSFAKYFKKRKLK